MLDDVAAGLLVPLPHLVSGKPIQSKVERVLDMLLEPRWHVAGLRSSPCLPELAHEHGRIDSRLLDKLSPNRILGGLPFVDAASGHLRSGLDIDMVEDQQPAAGIGHEGRDSLVAGRMPARHRRHLLRAADSLTAVSVHALILLDPPRVPRRRRPGLLQSRHQPRRTSPPAGRLHRTEFSDPDLNCCGHCAASAASFRHGLRVRSDSVRAVRRMVVLVNGLPAAGKSTLAAELAVALGLPLLSKDVIKETHAEVLSADPPPGLTQRDWNRKLGTAASETMWALLRDSAPGAVLESSWRTDVRQLVDAGLRRAGFAGAAEVWCEAPVPLLRDRFAQRWSSSHAIHGAAPGDDEWAQMIEHGEPLGLGPVLRVDTSDAIDMASVVEWCHAHAWAQYDPATGRR
jgi:predicted kinase